MNEFANWLGEQNQWAQPIYDDFGIKLQKFLDMGFEALIVLCMVGVLITICGFRKSGSKLAVISIVLGMVCKVVGVCV